MMLLLLLSALGCQGADDDLILPHEYRGHLGKEARALTDLQTQLQQECDAFNEERCKQCPKTHGECETPERCESICNADLSARVKDLLKREYTLRESLKSSLKSVELNLRHIHDRIRIYLDLKKALEECGDDPDRRREAWKRARIQAVVDGLGHVKTALCHRLEIFTDEFPKEHYKTISFYMDAIQEWGRDPQNLRNIAHCIQNARNAIVRAAEDLKPEAKREFWHVGESLEAIEKGMRQFIQWEEEGWTAVEPRVNQVSNEIRGVLEVGMKQYGWQVLYGKSPIGRTDADLAEDVDAGPYLAHRGLTYAAWALDMHSYDGLEVESRLEKLGKAYERQEALRELLSEAIMEK